MEGSVCYGRRKTKKRPSPGTGLSEERGRERDSFRTKEDDRGLRESVRVKRAVADPKSGGSKLASLKRVRGVRKKKEQEGVFWRSIGGNSGGAVSSG